MVEIRAVREDELETYIKTTAVAFGGRFPSDLIEPLKKSIEVERAFVAVDGDAIVGSGGTLSLELSVPGGASIPLGGLTWIGVLPTHRRRGALRGMIDRHFADVREREEPLAGLYASEAKIYGRFGYGVATLVTRYEIATNAATLREEIDDPGGVRLVDQAGFTGIADELHERIRRLQPGDVSRSEAQWRGTLAEWEEDASGFQGVVYALHVDAGGEPDGYLIYRLGEESWSDGIPNNRVDVYCLSGVDEPVRASLWRYLLNLDLVGTVRVLSAPVDEPLRWRLNDPRQLRTIRVSDGLWLRMIDVERSLASRLYGDEGRLVLAVDDPDQMAAGTFALEAGADGAICRRVEDEADLALDASALASMYLGGVSVTALAAAGRVEERREGAIDVAERLFRTPRPPFCDTTF